MRYFYEYDEDQGHTVYDNAQSYTRLETYHFRLGYGLTNDSLLWYCIKKTKETRLVGKDVIQ